MDGNKSSINNNILTKEPEQSKPVTKKIDEWQKKIARMIRNRVRRGYDFLSTVQTS